MAKIITLGSTGITAPQNGFGALPIQRVDMETAVAILRRAYEGGMRFFDTARAYTDSEEKLGNAFAGMREKIYITTKSHAVTPDELRKELAVSLEKLQTDYVDVYQFHQAEQCFKPGDGTGMYEAMLEFREQGKIRHIGITTHILSVAEEAIESGLYETLQFPYSYLSGEKELNLIRKCRERNMGFIGMKSLAGGLITNAEAAMAFTAQFDNLMPIWGVQKMSELEEWLSYMDKDVQLTPEISAFIEKERKELAGDFCRGCGYCMPCPVGILINNCARMSLLLRRAPSAAWLSEENQAEMMKIDQCLHCYQCASRCPYGLDTPHLLEKNLEDYKKVLAGEVSVA
ncbi:MAG: aldo/keto reductase [Solobacterium sp.]|nr:aldo/keto reductase [Solobacterium sp.]